ncbi:C40 family peptidase [Terrisporobacter petrolearius]|uniref:C40 family peptidase n=1 Tax=Terrisporobacter petrolearius TaxID=1460447 RepID=UPI0031CCD340
MLASNKKEKQSTYFSKICKSKLFIKAIGSLNLLFLFSIFFVISFFLILVGAKSSSKSGDGYFNTTMNGVPSEFIEYYNEASEIYGIPNWVLAGISKVESDFNPSCSYGGAYGIMQVQKTDLTTGEDLWKYLMDLGLGKIYKERGYSFSSTQDMWQKYLKDPRAQIIAGSYEIRYYANYVLYRQGKVKKIQFNSTDNMKLINWDSGENDKEFRNTLRRIFACYNGGPGYGMNVDLDNARNGYPNKVFGYAMEYRDTKLTGSIETGDNSTIEKAIKKGSDIIGKSTYVFGGGRTEFDIRSRRFDCSSFVHWCYAQAGISLGNQINTDGLAKVGKKVSKNEMKRGDIIFFNTYKYNGHVAIYLGSSGKFLHCSTSKGAWINSLDESYYKKVFNGNVRRVIN